MNDTLLYGISTMGFTFLAILVRYSFKSKCTDVSLCCSLISIKRDIKEEIKSEKLELEMGSNNDNKI